MSKTAQDVQGILLSKLPHWFKPILEYIAIIKAYGVELADFENAAEKIHANQYIQTCDSETLRYWERLLGLSYNVGDTDEFRRQRILLYLNQKVLYTVWHLKEELQSLYGDDFSLEVNEDECWIRIMVTSDIYGAVELLQSLIFRWVPAHLYVYSNQQVSNYVSSDVFDAARFTRTLEQTISIGGN